MRKPDPQSYQLPLLPDVTFGAYPGHSERTQAATRMQAFSDAGITCFIDLTEERDGLFPYMTLLPEVLTNGRRPPVHLRFPIRDMSVPAAPADLLPVLDALDDAVAERHSVYLHCWGGIGRTGMVAGCYLVRHGLTGELALQELKRAFAETPLGRVGRESPETERQRRFVLEWAKHDPKAKWPGPPDYEFRAKRYARLLIAEAGGDMEQARRVAEDKARAASLDGPQWAGRVWARVVELLMQNHLNVRPAEISEIPQLAQVWYDAWRDAHAEILPAELIRLRTLESFRDRLATDLPRVRVVGPPGSPVGLCTIKGDELYQLFVSAHARGTGAAARLVTDAEHRLAGNGVEIAWLSCAIGNERAARFYEKCGWHRVGTMVSELETTEGPFSLESWRYEKVLSSAPGPVP